LILNNQIVLEKATPKIAIVTNPAREAAIRIHEVGKRWP
jgi:hypothetical protein